MSVPEFTVIQTDDGPGVTYVCGCPCTPTARPDDDGTAGHEHCCCGKVHFVGRDAATRLSTYLEERKSRRKREPDYESGAATIEFAGAPVPVAWAFPRE